MSFEIDQMDSLTITDLDCSPKIMESQIFSSIDWI